MCGFPLMHLDKYLKVLVLQHKRFVAMCEEFPRYKSSQKPDFERRVVRVITPGTLIDEPFLNHYENNYLLAIAAAIGPCGQLSDLSSVGLAWIDVSTGEFFTKTASMDDLKDDLARISPREIVLSEYFNERPSHPIRQVIEDDGVFVSFVVHSTLGETASLPRDHFPTYTGLESEAVNILTTHMRANLLEHMPQLVTPNREGMDELMQIDSHTIKALEIRESGREGGTTGSLLSIVKRTVTSGGTRLLARRLCRFLSIVVAQVLTWLAGSPSASIKEIEARQSLVAFFYDRAYLRDDIVQMLKECGDATRVVQKFLLGKGDPGDLLSITRTIDSWMSIQQRLLLEKDMEVLRQACTSHDDWDGISTLMSCVADLRDLSHRISLALGDGQNAEYALENSNEDDLLDENKAVQVAGAYKWTVKPE